jgi:hypothetical protein
MEWRVISLQKKQTFSLPESTPMDLKEIGMLLVRVIFWWGEGNSGNCRHGLGTTSSPFCTVTAMADCVDAPRMNAGLLGAKPMTTPEIAGLSSKLRKFHTFWLAD